MYSRLQDAAMYQRLKQAADIVGAAATGTSAVEMKGYAKVGAGEDSVGMLGGSDDEDDEGGGSGAPKPEEAEYWTTKEVCEYLRMRLLSFEGADVETVNELLSTFEEREVDGHTLLALDDLQLRYELDIGAVVVRETLMRIIDQLRQAPKVSGKSPRQKNTANKAKKTAAGGRKNKKGFGFGGRRASGGDGFDERGESEDVGGDAYDYEDDDDEDEDDDDDEDEFDERARKERQKAKSERRQARSEERKEMEVRMLVRVAALISGLAVVYNVVSQALQNWHSRTVTMKGPGEEMTFATDMGLWSFSSSGHYHNDNMYANLLPNSNGFDWTDDYDVSDTYDHSKWQCKPPTNKAVKDFCASIEAAQACAVLGMLCTIAVLAHSLLGVSYDRPVGCSRAMALVSGAQAIFAFAGMLCADAAFTAQLQRYGDKDITASECSTHYLSFSQEKDDDWYDDDWGYNRLLQNDDHFEVAHVSCGYSVAFVLQCFVPFFALVQVWCYVQIHRTVPRSGDGIGVFLVKKRGGQGQGGMEMHVRTPDPSSDGHVVYKIGKKKKKDTPGVSNGGSGSSSQSPPRHKLQAPSSSSAAERRERLNARGGAGEEAGRGGEAGGGGARRSKGNVFVDQSYDAYADDPDEAFAPADDEPFV